jgi:hypothetical protein
VARGRSSSQNVTIGFSRGFTWKRELANLRRVHLERGSVLMILHYRD